MSQLYKGVGYGPLSYKIMTDIYKEAKAKGMSPSEIAAKIDASYPWENKGSSHRYRRWLDARREFFTRHNLPGLRPRRMNLVEAARKIS